LSLYASVMTAESKKPGTRGLVPSK
jgi:hypothetical protein